MKLLLFIQLCVLIAVPSRSQQRHLDGFEEVFAWKQLTYNIGGYKVLTDRFSEDDLADSPSALTRRNSDSIIFINDAEDDRDFDHRPASGSPTAPAVINPSDEIGRFFVQYNNLPMGVEKVGDRLFITVPRRRYGIPSTINYIDLSETVRSPAIAPYPNILSARSVISVYRTRADECGRLWAVDTGAIEIPNNVTYLQRPAILIYDLNTNRRILRYPLKESDTPETNTATGLASITIEIRNGDCNDAYAYIADVVSYGVIVFSLKELDSWRHTHNYFSFMPTAGNLNVAGQSFQWNDGVFSITLGRNGYDGCRIAYFHAMASTQEFSVSSCELQKKQTNQQAFTLLGDRGFDAQSTMHGYHLPSDVIFFADIGRDAISCWNVKKPLTSGNVHILTRDPIRMSYPSDLHVTGDEVWVMANTLPKFIYSRLDPNQYNFFIYKAKVQDLIAGTPCSSIPNFGGQYYRRS